MSKEEIISGMELIMHITSFYCHPNDPQWYLEPFDSVRWY